MPLSQQQQRELKRLGARIKELRKKKGMTQNELANATGMDFQNISRLERGDKNAVYLTIKVIAKGLGVMMSELLEGLD